MWYSRQYRYKLFINLLHSLAKSKQSALCYVLVMIPSKKKAYQSLAFFAGDRIYTHVVVDSNPDYIRVCNQSAIKLFKSTLSILGIVVSSMIILLIFPMYAFVFKNDIQLPIPVVLPFTDLRTKNGIILNLANQVFMVLIGATGNIGIKLIYIRKNTYMIHLLWIFFLWRHRNYHLHFEK